MGGQKCGKISISIFFPPFLEFELWKFGGPSSEFLKLRVAPEIFVDLNSDQLTFLGFFTISRGFFSIFVNLLEFCKVDSYLKKKRLRVDELSKKNPIFQVSFQLS